MIGGIGTLMPKILLIPYGWLGDRFFTTSVATVIKRYMDAEVYMLSTPEFSFMDDVLGTLNSLTGIVTHEEASQMRFDYAFEMPHTDHAENPTKTYCRNILQVEDFDDLDFSPEFISKDNLVGLTNFETPFDRYVTYQIDWQNRTRWNVEYIISTLEYRGVRCVPIGKRGLSNQGNVNDNRISFHDSLVKIAHADYHLCMLGGTAVMATYVDTPTLVSMDWHYYKHNDYNLSLKDFMQWWKLTPNSLSGTNKHHIFLPHPFTKEDEVIQYTLERVQLHD